MRHAPFAALVASLALSVAAAQESTPTVRLRLPSRPAAAVTGSAFLAQARGANVAEREAGVAREVERGNVPDFLRVLCPVTLRADDRDGRARTLTVYVTPDYLAIGSDADFARMPLTPAAAERIAAGLGCVLPTRRVVDAIHAQAEIKLAPSPLKPTSEMVLPSYFLAHQRRIEAQWQALGSRARRGALTAGHKKDVVRSARLLTRPGRVAIYGWHRTNGRPIQPLSTVHTSDYADYSHGVRLVHETARIDGQPRRVVEVLSDPTLWPLLSDEGPLPAPQGHDPAAKRGLRHGLLGVGGQDASAD
jgi:hypothetical protein